MWAASANCWASTSAPSRGTIEPHVDNNWKLVGDNWNAADHEKAVKLLREGKLALSENADSRTLPGKAITTADIAAF